MLIKHFIFSCLILIISINCFSQKNNINGTWEGQFYGAITDLGQPRLVVEIYDFKDSMFTGISHLYYEENKYEHYKIIGWYDKKDSLLVFREVETIAVDLGRYGNCLGTYKSSLSRLGNYLYMTGFWDPNIIGCTVRSKKWLKKYTPLEKEISKTNKKDQGIKKQQVPVKPVPAEQLKRQPIVPVTTPVISKPINPSTPAIKNTPVVLPPKIALRQTDIQSLLEIAVTEKDSIRVDVYDNGEIDGDSVSVYQEDVVRVNKKMITANPITFYLSLDKNINPIAHLRLVAESLGSIPPCTALMIVTTKTKRYEVHLSSNFSKNATVELFLKE